MKENVKTVGVHSQLQDQWHMPLFATKFSTPLLIAICCRKST